MSLVSHLSIDLTSITRGQHTTLRQSAVLSCVVSGWCHSQLRSHINHIYATTLNAQTVSCHTTCQGKLTPSPAAVKAQGRSETWYQLLIWAWEFKSESLSFCWWDWSMTHISHLGLQVWLFIPKCRQLHLKLRFVLMGLKREVESWCCWDWSVTHIAHLKLQVSLFIADCRQRAVKAQVCVGGRSEAWCWLLIGWLRVLRLCWWDWIVTHIAHLSRQLQLKLRFVKLRVKRDTNCSSRAADNCQGESCLSVCPDDNSPLTRPAAGLEGGVLHCPTQPAPSWADM